MRGVPEEAAGGTITSARVIYLFDAVMAAMPANAAIHLGPGVFETMGFAPNITGGWTPKTGQKILGSGIDVTVLRLVKATSTANPTTAIGVPYFDFLIHFEAREMTIDCNLGGQPIPKPLDFAPVTCNAINVYGRHIRLSRIRAINFGNQAGIECFALFSGGAHPTYEDNNQEVYDCVIENCIAEQPAENNVSETSIMGFFSGEDDGGRVAFNRAVAVRNNFVNGEYANGVRAEVETLTFVGNLGTLTTKTPHRHVDYKNVFLQGVTNATANEPFNGVFPIEEILSDTVLTFRTWFTPTITPEGAMFIGGGVPSHFVPITKLEPVAGYTRRFKITTETPHYRTVKNNIVVNGVIFPEFNGSFLVTQVKSPTELEYTLNQDPEQEQPPPVSGRYSIGVLFIGPGGITGCRSGICEGNRIYNCWFGSNHDTGSSKESIVRNNHYLNVYAGYVENMGGFSPLKVGSPLVRDTANPTRAIFTSFDNHDLEANDQVTIEGAVAVDPLDGVAKVSSLFNGTFTVLEVLDERRFKYAMAGDPTFNAYAAFLFRRDDWPTPRLGVSLVRDLKSPVCHFHCGGAFQRPL
jgi:hypothetical protein